MTRRPIRKKAIVESRRLQDRPLVFLGPDDEVWADGLLPSVEFAGAIVWLKPPNDVKYEVLIGVKGVLQEKGAHVKLLPPDRVDEVALTARAELARPELGVDDAREVVYQLCRELAATAGVPVDDAIREAETYLSAVDL